MRRVVSLLLLIGALTGCAATPRTPEGLPTQAPVAATAAAVTEPVLARLPAGERTADLIAAAVGAPFELALGEQIAVGDSGVSLAFVAVDEDSRCPSGVSCLWQGRAVVSLELLADGQEAQSFSLAIPGNITPDAPELRPVGGYTLRLVDLAPYPELPDRSIEPYVVTLVLEAS